MKTLKLFTLLTILAVVLSSCGNKKAKTGDASAEAFDLQQYIEAAKAITPNMDNIGNYIDALELVDAKYYPMLMNDPYKAQEYKTSFPVAAVNLGIYSIDIIYHVYGDAIDAAYLSFAAAQELARFVGVEGAFAATTFDAFEGAAASRDSVTLMFNNLLTESQNYSTEKEILFVHTAYLAGAYIEKMYIMSSLIQQALKSDEFTQEDEINLKESIVIYVERLKSVDVLLTAIEAQIDQLKSLELLAQFQELRTLATSIEAGEAEILAASNAELRESEKLQQSFDIISNIRSMLVTTN